LGGLVAVCDRRYRTAAERARAANLGAGLAGAGGA